MFRVGKYRYTGDPKKSSDPSTQDPKADNGRFQKKLIPRRLCFMSEDEGTAVKLVREWMIQTKAPCPRYLFISFAKTHFPTDEDVKVIRQLAERATREAGLQCYWLSVDCIVKEHGEERVYDVWRISDVIRRAEKLVVVLRDHTGDQVINGALTDWYRSIWTFLELLLSAGSDFQVLYRHTSTSSAQARDCHLTVPKNRLAYYCGIEDKHENPEQTLLDHYLDNRALLNSLHLAVEALNSLNVRVPGSTDVMYFAGDYTYALMGLLNWRPNINPTDSAFLAFARLFMENSGDKLLERFLCLQPVSFDQDWFLIKDEFRSELSNIHPTIQVSGIGKYVKGEHDMAEIRFDFDREKKLPDPEVQSVDDLLESAPAPGPSSDSGKDFDPDPDRSKLRDDDVVLVEGCRAASIYWDGFRDITFPSNRTGQVYVALICTTSAVFLIAMICAVILYAIEEGKPEEEQNGAFGWTFGVFVTVVVVVQSSMPFIVRKMYRGRPFRLEPTFFGFEGYLPIHEVEKALLGTHGKRLSWSPKGCSTLSRSEAQNIGKGVDPCSDTSIAEKVKKAQDAIPGNIRIFTIVDTFSETVSLIEAVQPPEILLVCATESRYRRVLACSYDSLTRCFFKEAVLRMDYNIADRFQSMGRLQLAIRNPMKKAQPKSKKSFLSSLGLQFFEGKAADNAGSMV